MRRAGTLVPSSPTYTRRHHCRAPYSNIVKRGALTLKEAARLLFAPRRRERESHTAVARQASPIVQPCRPSAPPAGGEAMFLLPTAWPRALGQSPWVRRQLGRASHRAQLVRRLHSSARLGGMHRGRQRHPRRRRGLGWASAIQRYTSWPRASRSGRAASSLSSKPASRSSAPSASRQSPRRPTSGLYGSSTSTRRYPTMQDRS
mmetsp:Transcript_57597/g.132280  ORF Transcript_57597/g.132280 Transcript_57597/m.132280 type:complete len:204 (+) Transcript_57597:632-1243(+)